MVDIWFLNVSLVFSQRSLSADRLFRRAVLRFTLKGRVRVQKNASRGLTFNVRLIQSELKIRLMISYLSLDRSQVSLDCLGL